jgi:hypothetical protein
MHLGKSAVWMTMSELRPTTAIQAIIKQAYISGRYGRRAIIQPLFKSYSTMVGQDISGVKILTAHFTTPDKKFEIDP